MLNHPHTIGRLTEAQKIRLLTDIHSLADPELSDLGVPRVRCGFVQDVSGGAFPAPYVLARSWDKALLSDVSQLQCRLLFGAGNRHVFLPEAKVRLTPFGNGLSEDPVLAGELAGAYLAGANRAGMSASLSGYGLTPAEESRLGAPVTPRSRYTFLDVPYVYARRGGACAGIEIRTPADEIPKDICEGNMGFTLCRHAEGAETVRVLSDGMICLNGSASAVQAALHEYRRLTAAIQQGKAATGELEAACRAGEAISEETLDMALDRLLDFATQCTAHPAPSESEGEEADIRKLQRRAILSSVVLLENRPLKKGGRRTLPLKFPRNVCLVGDMFSAEEGSFEDAVARLTALGCGSAGYVRGYDRRSQRNDQLLRKAVAEAEQSDVVILLMGMDAEQARLAERERRCTLPAAQLALYDEISRLNKTVIVVISSSVTPDLSFLTAGANPPSAVLLAPLEETDGLGAVLEIIMGEAEPSGRLPVTLCAREAYPELFQEGRRVGPFVGYRYFDSMGCGALYPFGHGLTYTSFRYSDLKVSGGEVSFTICNTGKRVGTEVAQVYLGLPGSRILRPKKELVGFACVELAPGERKTVTLPLSPLPICTEDGRLLTEQGTYTLSVGASVSDIRLSTTWDGGTDPVPADGEHPEEYLPSLSNILSQHYLMEAEYLSMKPSLRNLLFGIAALVLAVSVKAYDVVTRADSLFLDIVAGVLAVGAIACFVLELIDRRRQHALEDDRMEEANAALFADATTISVPSAAALFAVEDELEREATAEAADSEEGNADEYDHFADVDKDLTISEATRELATLAREKGISVSETTLRSIFASMAVSHLAVVHGMDDGCFAALIALLGEYFACPAAVDTVDGSYRSETDVLFATDSTGNREPRNTLRAVISARNEPGKIHIAALSHVDPATMSAYFVPFARHAHAPHSNHIVECHGGDGADATYVLSENLWLILNLDKNAAVCRLPDHISEIATVNSWPLETKGAPAEAHSEFRHFGYGQMEYLRDRLRSDFSADEETWKKVDRLVAYAAQRSDFHASNKHWLGMEMYMAALMSSGAEESPARDEAMAVKLMPSLVSALNGRISREDRGISETLDAIFGEDHTALCRKAVKESGADLT